MDSIKNEALTIKVKKHGAELASIVCDGREYLWQADEAFWKRHSPVLFPLVGAVWGGKFRSHGEEFAMGQHGFARDMDFTLIHETADELRYALCSTEETLKRYPYPFRLEIGYRLEGRSVRVTWHVENSGQEVMAFQIGAHPAFYWPMLTNEEIEAEIKRISDTWYLWASRYTGDVVEDFKTLVNICKDEKNCNGFCNLFEDDIKCFDKFKKKYGIEPSYSIGKGEYHYDDEEDDAWSNLCYEFSTAVRPVLCMMWTYNHIVTMYIVG